MEALILDEYKADDEFLDDIREDGETASGSSTVRRKFKNTLEDSTGPAKPLDADVLFTDAELEDAAPDANHESTRLVSVGTAKEQIASRLRAAKIQFGSLPKETQEPAANDNYRKKESCPVLDQLARSAFESDQYQRLQFISTFKRVRELVILVGSDALGMSVHLPGKNWCTDFGQQKATNGKPIFETGQTLDRKWRVYDTKNGELESKRFDGPIRIAKGSSSSNDNFDVYRDMPHPADLINGRMELDEILAAVGPLAIHLLAGIGGASMTEIGETTGARNTQAPGVGSAIIRMALTAAREALERCNETSGETYLQRLQQLADAAPVPARRLKRALEDAQFDRLAA